MKLPANVLACLTLVAGCEMASDLSRTTTKTTPTAAPVAAEPVEVEIEEMPQFAQPPPGVAPRTPAPAPTPVVAPKPAVTKKKPGPKPVFHANNCGPCGMG